MHKTYADAVRQLVSDRRIDPADTIIVSCGGAGDATVLRRSNFADALIVNLDERQSTEIAPFRWCNADAENLPYADDSFDWGFVHAGLHHCRSPHRGLVELLRVCRRGVLVIEARDSFVMRLAVRLRLTPEYELEAVATEGGSGGLRNGPVPNFIYRWTEREVRKTVESAMPGTINELHFFYGLRLPDQRMTMCSPAKRAAVSILGGVLRVLFRLIPKQGNEFGFAVIKTGKRKPWIGADLALDPDFALGFDPAKYRRAA